MTISHFVSRYGRRWNASRFLPQLASTTVTPRPAPRIATLTARTATTANGHWTTVYRRTLVLRGRTPRSCQDGNGQ